MRDKRTPKDVCGEANLSAHSSYYPISKVSLELEWLLAFCTVVQVTVICILGKNMNENDAKDYAKYMTSCRVKWTLHLIKI